MSQGSELIAAFRTRLIEPRRSQFVEVFDRGVARGDVSADTDIAAIAEALVGAIYARRILGRPADAAWVSSLVETL